MRTNPKLPHHQFACFPAFLLMTGFLLLPVLACSMGEEEPPWTPETPKMYSAVTPDNEVYVLIDQTGNVVDFGSSYAYGVTAKMHYLLRFWDVGSRGAGEYQVATAYKVYTPVKITAIHDEEKYTPEERAEIYARTGFPSTEVKVYDMSFSGGPEGTFLVTNLMTDKEIYGYMDWREKEWEMHACFYHDLMKRACLQDFQVLGEEPFYNWP
jgi:hypothetical protein